MEFVVEEIQSKDIEKTKREYSKKGYICKNIHYTPGSLVKITFVKE